MRDPLVLSFVVFVTLSAAPFDTHALCPACVDKSRDNSRCEWIGDTAFPVEPSNPAHQRHLIQDAQLAEGLAVRFADAEYGRRFGIEHHGGLIDNGGVVKACMGRMFSDIERNHAVTADQIETARAQRNAGFDATVRVLFLPFFLLAAVVVHRAIDRRFLEDGRGARVAAIGLASVAVGLLGSYLLVLWSMPWEGIRVGNGHIGGYRLATFNRHGAGVVVIGAMLGFWLIGMIQRRISVALMVGAATASCAFLAAMFVRTFATSAVGYVSVSIALLAVVLGIGRAAHLDRTNRVGDSRAPARDVVV